MLQFLMSHILYVAIGVGAIVLILVLRFVSKQNAVRKKQKEMSLLQKRNEALNETLRNPKMQQQKSPAAGPMEVQWDEKAIESRQKDNPSLMIELIEFSTYSRRKYLFPAELGVSVGSGADNQLVLQREGVAPQHCAFFQKDGAIAVRSISNQKTLLLRGKTSALVGAEGVFLNNGDHIHIGTADLQFRSFKA